MVQKIKEDTFFNKKNNKFGRADIFHKKGKVCKLIFVEAQPNTCLSIGLHSSTY